MANYIKFFDSVDLRPLVSSELKKKDNFVNVANGPLVIKIAATHAGLITRNNGFYLPDRMRKGAETFTAHYGKPIQTHHNDNADPIGRVLAAEYVDISSGIRDAFLEKVIGSSHGRYNDQFVKDFMVGKTSYLQSVNFIADSLSNQNSILEDPNYKGLGYIQLTASITDPEAKQKILDGRYLTGSVGVSTNRAVCSVCKQDWVTDGVPCEHKPGKVYDGTKAFIITGDLSYDEYSFVNTPADRHSAIIETSINGIKDSVKMDESHGRSLSVDIITDSVDETNSKGTINVQEANMNEKVKELLISMKDKFALVDDTQIEGILATFKDVDVSTLEEVELQVDAEAKLDRASMDKIFVLNDTAVKFNAIKTLRPFAEETGLKTIADATYETVDALYTAINEMEWQDYSELEDEALIAYLAEHPEDAKLSTSARKKLPGSSFCGPNKSFPVPDKAHVTAARRLIGRASVSSATKAKILSCVSRKAAAMGKDALVTESEVIVPSTEPVIENKDNCTTCTENAAKLVELQNKLDELTTKFETANTANTVTSDSLKKELDSANKDLKATREELKITHDDLMQMADQLVTSQEASTALLVDKVITFKTLSGEKIEDSVKLTGELIALGDAAVKDQLNQLVSKVDMVKIADSINSGLARIPVGSVADPTLKLEETIKIYTKDSIKAVADEYLRIKLGGNSGYGRGPQAAELYKRDAQLRGLLPTG